MAAENPIEKANQAFVAGDYQGALALWTSALSSVGDEHHYALHTNRGAALERLGQIEEAIKAYDEALKSKPDHVEALHNRGVALKALKRFPEALASFEQALSFKADFYPSLRGRSDALTILERFEEAIAAASAASAVRPEDPSPYSDRAFAELKLRRLDDALEHYEQALGLGDASPETRRLQAIALSQRAVELDKEGDLAKAEAYYNKAIDFEATESRLFNRAFLYMRTGRTDEAIAGYKAVAAMSPVNFQARAALGTLLLQREAFADAIPALKEAEELNPSAADITFNLGFAYLRENRVDEAEAQFKKALEADPTLENAKNGLEAVEAARGNGKLTLTVGESVEVPAHAAAAPSAVGGAAASSAPAPAARSTGAAAAPASISSAAASRPMGSGSPAAGRRDARASVPPQLMGALSAAVRGPAMVSMAAAAAGASAAGSADDEAKFATDTDGVEGVVHGYDSLKAPGPYPGGVDTTHREAYLSRDEFKRVFGVSKPELYAMPKWKRTDLRKRAGLF